MKLSIRKKKFFLPLIITIIVAAGLVLLFFFLKKKAENMLAAYSASSIQEAQASTGDIHDTVSGSGSLNYASSQSISIPVGIEIEKVYVSIGDTVTKGQKLASVDSASAAGALYELNNKIEDLENTIKNLPAKADDESSNEYLQKVQLEKQLQNLKDTKEELSDIYKTGLIKAGCDGVIDAVNIAPGTVSGADITTGSQPSADSGNLPDLSSFIGMSSSVSPTQAIACTASESDNAPSPSPAAPMFITEKDLSTLTIAAPKSGAAPQTTVGETNAYSGVISWDCQGTFEMGNTYTATILLSSKNGYAFSSADDYGIIIAGATISNDTPKIIGGDKTPGNKLMIKATFQTPYDDLDDTYYPTDDEYPEDALPDTGITEKDVQKALKKFQKSLPEQSGGNAYDALEKYAQNSLPDYSGSLPSGADLSGLEDAGLNSTSSYDMSQMTAFTIASGNKMVVSVQINELDINSVEVGQKAEITLDALEDEMFRGKITNLRTAPSDGSTNYIAEITLKRANGMRTGMRASAEVNIREANDVIIIPVDALQEDGDSYFVFTELDKDKNLDGKQTVKPGISDGTNVEIISGLSEGDTYYYSQSSNMLDDLFSGDTDSEEENMNEY